MRAVSFAEAASSLERLQSWAESSGKSGGGSIGELVFERGIAGIEEVARKTSKFDQESLSELVPSLTEGAFQRNWRVPSEFPLCPPTASEGALVAYLESLSEGATFARHPKFETGRETTVVKAMFDNSRNAICLIGDMGVDGVKRWALAKVYIEDGKFIHESEGTFFGEEGAEKYFQIALGNEWSGGDVFDDYC